MSAEIGYDSYGQPFLLGAYATLDGLRCPCGWSEEWGAVRPAEEADRLARSHAFAVHSTQERANLGGNPAPVIPPTYGDLVREMLAKQPTCKHGADVEIVEQIGVALVVRYCSECGMELPLETEA